VENWKKTRKGKRKIQDRKDERKIYTRRLK